MWMFEKILSFLFPPHCFYCKKENTSVCLSCIKKLDKNIAPLPYWIYTTYSFRDKKVSSSFHHMKYYHRKDIIEPLIKGTLGDGLVNFINTIPSPIVLVPIPMSTKRKWFRGYNQAEEISKHYGNFLSLPVHKTLLTRNTATPQQARIKHRRERLKNIRGVFSVEKTPLDKNISVILVDDLTTTTATLTEARKTLQRAGFTHVYAITLAH